MNTEPVETKNALIEKTSLSIEDHGLLTAYLYLKYDSAGQGFGGYALHIPSKEIKYMGTAGHFIFRCLKIAGVGRWEDLIGKTIRVKSSHSKVHAIGHIIEEDWFNPAIDFKDLK